MGIDDGAYTIGALKIFSGAIEVVARVFTGTTTLGESRQFSFESSVFQEENGQVVMKAGRFTRHVGAADRDWISRTIQSGYVGSGYLNTPPDIDQIYTEAFTATSPQLEYTIDFITTGTYYVGLRGYAPDGAGDSIYLSLNTDTQAALTPTLLSSFAPRQWNWTNRRGDGQNESVAFDVTTPGPYTFYLWSQEDGLRLDRVILTTNSAYRPEGDGPAESAQIDWLDYVVNTWRE